jgi:hypothetical protein
MPCDCTLLRLDASLAIPTRVLRFEVSVSPRRTLVRPVLVTSNTGLTHRSDRPDVAAFRSSALALWLSQVTNWFCDEPLETPRTWCGVPPISSHDLVPPPAPRPSRLDLGFEAQPETVHSFVLMFLPPCGPHMIQLATGSLEPSLLVCSTPGGPPTYNFHTCSSPAPTPIKLQPTPVILSQESVHTTLSITHHTMKRPSTSPRTTQALR